MSDKPTILLLCVSVALALGACNRSDQPAVNARGDGGDDRPAAASAYTLDESKLSPINRFDPADVDTSKSACADFAGYINGKWLAANKIPGDRTSWGAFEMLDERSIGIQHQLAEQAAAKADTTGIDKIVGDFYATGMDQAKINAQGIKPLESRLAEIDAITDGAAVAAYLRKAYAAGEGQLFGFGAEADFKNSSMNIAYAGQGGLGLPDKGYYFDADKKDKLGAYEKHVAKVLELSGVTAADAAKQAKEVIAFETRLAKVSKSREELSRDVSLYYNPISLADADKLTPNFPWTEFFKSQDLTAPDMFSLAIPAFHQEISKAIGELPVDQWKSYLRFHMIDSASPYLSDAFVQENYDFYNKTMRGQAQIQERWKRVLARSRRRLARLSASSTSRWPSPPNPKHAWSNWWVT